MHLLAAWAQHSLKKKSNIDYFNYDAYENFAFLWAHLLFLGFNLCHSLCRSIQVAFVLVVGLYGIGIDFEISFTDGDEMICQCLIILYTDNKLCDIWK